MALYNVACRQPGACTTNPTVTTMHWLFEWRNLFASYSSVAEYGTDKIDRISRKAKPLLMRPQITIWHKTNLHCVLRKNIPDIMYCNMKTDCQILISDKCASKTLVHVKIWECSITRGQNIVFRKSRFLLIWFHF